MSSFSTSLLPPFSPPFLWITEQKPAVILAPMEGVTDAPMRALLTERGGLHFCVSEFIRVTQDPVPARTFYQSIPEVRFQCKTPSGIPIQIQLLGSHEENMALSAIQACQLGAGAIDLNFGCPSPTVNRHEGGASLLRFPQRIRKIVAAVRNAVPKNIPVSAKLRLGWECMDDIFVNVEHALLGGADWVTIHARTKVQGYAPPAHWKYIGEVKRRFQVPIVANGEIWSREDFLQCQEQTQCKHFMLGRGALGNPFLAKEISILLGVTSPCDEVLFVQNDSQAWAPLLRRFCELHGNLPSSSQTYILCRIKKWLRLASVKTHLPGLDQVKRTQSLEELFSVLAQESRSQT